MRLDLRYRIDRHVNDDQQAGAARKKQADAGLRDDPLRYDTNHRQVDRPNDADPGQDIVEIGRGILTRTDARNEPAIALQILGRLFRIEYNSRVKEREENDAQGIEQHEDWLAVPEILVDSDNERPPGRIRRDRVAGKLRDRQRQQQQRAGEDRRNHARRVELQRQVAAIGLHHPVLAGALWILDQQAARRTLHEADHQDQDNEQCQQAEDQKARDRAGAAAFEQVRYKGRHLCDDTGHNDQRGAVADPAAGDLLTQPQQEHGATNQRDQAGHIEQRTRIDCKALHFCGTQRGIALDDGKKHGAIARILVQLTPTALTFLLQRHQRGMERSGQLNHDRRSDVGHHPQGDQAVLRQRAARKHVEEVQHPAGVPFEELLQRDGVDPRQRHKGEEAEHDQRSDSEPDPLFKLGRLGEVGETEVARDIIGA